ncbi:MAG: nucleotidyltransferase family protein [Clostridia bacterium]|nr:nucleotidyltransferase family protein [Clostridia bacterium]
MTRVCGVVAEYDPFHNGHAWHLREARRVTGADFIVCVMSMHFTQRGMPALLAPHVRAEMALCSGADAVLGLPVSFSVCEAERFARGGLSILRALGADCLSFGAEPESLPLIKPAAQLLDAPDAAFQSRLRALLGEGLSFPKAQGQALAEALGVDAALLAQPNAALGIAYARANKALGTELELFPLPRSGSYHDETLPVDALPSATAVRAAALAGDWERVRAAMPKEAFSLLEQAFAQGDFHPPQALDALLRWRLRAGDDFSALPALSEGLENRLPRAADCLSREEMIRAVKTKRYPYARISRLLTHVLLGTDAKLLSPLPTRAYVLGFRREASGLLKSSDSLALLPSLPTRAADAECALDARAADLWALGAGQPFGSLYRCKPVIVE